MDGTMGGEINGIAGGRTQGRTVGGNRGGSGKTNRQVEPDVAVQRDIHSQITSTGLDPGEGAILVAEKTLLKNKRLTSAKLRLYPRLFL